MTMARLTKDQWNEARAMRESGASISKVAEKFNIDRAAVSRRAKAEKWADGSDGNAAANIRAFEKVTGIVTSHDPKRRAESIEAAADIKAGVIQSQQADWQIHRETFGPTVLEEFDRLKCAKISAEMLKIRHEGERKAYGIAEVVDSTGEDNEGGGLEWGD